ncbi:MAG: hypothetical protein GY778_29905 [bacterium]|nr:hypothetical protein [bacterium]
MAAVAFAAAAFVSFWGYHLPGQRAQITTQDWLIENDPGHTWHCLVRLANLPVRLIACCPVSNTNAGYAVIGILLATGLVVALRRRFGREGWLFAAWYLVPVAFLAATDLASSRGMMGHLRFATIGIGGLVGLLALAVDSLPRTWRAAALAVLAIAVLASLSYPTRRNAQAREAAALLAHQVGPGDLVVYDGVGHPPYWSGRLMLLTSYYAPASRYPAILLQEPPPPEVLAEMSGYRRLFVVSGWTDRPVRPVPASHQLTAATDPLWGIGPIRVYERPPE